MWCCAHARTCDELSCYIRDEPGSRFMKRRKWIILVSAHVALAFERRRAEPWTNPLRAALLNRAVYGNVYHSAAPSEQIHTSLHRRERKKEQKHPAILLWEDVQLQSSNAQDNTGRNLWSVPTSQLLVPIFWLIVKKVIMTCVCVCEEHLRNIWENAWGMSEEDLKNVGGTSEEHARSVCAMTEGCLRNIWGATFHVQELEHDINPDP